MTTTAIAKKSKSRTHLKQKVLPNVEDISTLNIIRPHQASVVTPSVAKLLLEKNKRNRGVSTATVAAYVRDIKSGAWELNGETIKVSVDGDIIDGQHRLLAIIKADLPVKVFVIGGLLKEVQMTVDTGRKRSFSDELGMRNVVNSKALVATIRQCLAHEFLGFGGSSKSHNLVTSHEIEEFYLAHSTSLQEVMPLSKKLAKDINIAPSIIAAMYLTLSNIDKDATYDFFHSLAMRTTAGDGDPRLALLRSLDAIGRKTSHNAPALVAYSLVFRSWNAWRKNQRVTLLRTVISGKAVPIPTKLV